MSRELPTLPTIDVEIVDDRTAGSRPDEGFLRVRRLELRNRYEDGSRSSTYAYDVVERSSLDAVCVVIWCSSADGPRVLLRSSLRPPLVLRRSQPLPLPYTAGNVLWEIPAGLVELDEKGEEGLRACVAREVLEETGFDVSPASVERLGPPVFLSPGVIGEQIHFFALEVSAASRGEPTTDGHPVEERAAIAMIPLEAALAACDDGLVEDAKSELGLRRFARRSRPA